MKIVFLTRFSPKYPNIWSGTLFQIYQKLSERYIVENDKYSVSLSFVFKCYVRFYQKYVPKGTIEKKCSNEIHFM